MAEERPAEGVVFSSYGAGNTGIRFDDVKGTLHTSTEILGLSKSQLETMDLISEGPIVGPVSGEWTKTGVLGEIGWRSATFTGFNTPNNFEDSKILRSIYWNEVPVLNDNAQFNFQNINIKFTEGKPNGDVIQVLSPFQTVSRTIGERLRAGEFNAKTYRILNKDCRGVVVNVKIPTLVAYNKDNEIIRTRIDYSISYRPIFINKSSPDYIVAKNETVFGKVTNSPYIRTTRIDFFTNFLNDPAFYGWEIKINRSTEESTTSKISNQTFIDSLTEIQGNIYTFPNSAMVRSLFDAEYFSTVPERAFDVELLKVKIPGNYNPILKTYSGVGFATDNGGWNGQFATGRHHTDNPAWCFYDLLTNKRYGLGKYIDEDLVDVVSLYEISQYCDTLVSDGFGGLEPRFTCNLWLTQREEAFKVANDMASIFRGMTYYANGLIYAVQDSPKNSNLVFTNANVEDGNFNYSTSSRKTRNSVAIVRYNDPKNFYKPAIEYVEDFESIRKYGIREIEMTAFGCTSKGQATRLGRWALLSDKLEPESINFVAGIGEAAYLRPGHIFKVHDSNRKLKRYGGRTVSVKDIATTGSEVVLDYKIDTEPTVEYKISFLTPSFNYNSSQVTGLTSNDVSNIRKSFLQEFYFSGFQSTTSGNRTLLHLRSGFDYSNYFVTGQQTWMMELSDRYETYTGNRYFADDNYDYYRAINIIEKEPHKFEVVGLQYNPQKYIEIESGLLFQKDLTNQIQIPASPYNLNLDIYNVAANVKTIAYSFLIDDISNVDSYKIYAKHGAFPDNNIPAKNYLINTLPPFLRNGKYYPAQTGDYYFRVYSSNDKQSIYSPNFASGIATIYNFDQIQDVIISALRVESITGLYSGSVDNGGISVLTDNDANPTFTWQVGSNNPFVITGDIKYRATVRESERFPTSRIPTSGYVYQETGLSITDFLFSLDKNISSVGGPYRDYQVVVEAHDSQGKTSAGNQIGQNEANRWNTFPNGYDIIAISHPRVPRAEMSYNIPTERFLNSGLVSATGEHSSYQYINGDGLVSIQVLSGRLNSDLVGGYLYVSSGQFPIYETQIRSGIWKSGVSRTRFDFSPSRAEILAPNGAINFRSNPYSYAAVSFYDEVDKALLEKGVEISTGLNLSNNFIIFNNSYFSSPNGDSAIYTKRISGVATGLFDPLIISGMLNGEIPVAYAPLAGNTNVVYITESYETKGAFTGVPELPDLLVGGNVSGVGISAMSLTFDNGYTYPNAPRIAVIYSHPDLVSEYILHPSQTAVSTYNLKASGDSLGIAMSGAGNINIEFADSATNTWSVVTELNVTYLNGQQSTKRNSNTFTLPSSFEYDILLDSALGGGKSSSPIISNILEYQKFPTLV